MGVRLAAQFLRLQFLRLPTRLVEAVDRQIAVGVGQLEGRRHFHRKAELADLDEDLRLVDEAAVLRLLDDFELLDGLLEVLDHVEALPPVESDPERFIGGHKAAEGDRSSEQCTN